MDNIERKRLNSLHHEYAWHAMCFSSTCFCPVAVCAFVSIFMRLIIPMIPTSPKQRRHDRGYNNTKLLFLALAIFCFVFGCLFTVFQKKKKLTCLFTRVFQFALFSTAFLVTFYSFRGFSFILLSFVLCEYITLFSVLV